MSYVAAAAVTTQTAFTPTATKTAAYTATANQFVPADATSASFTISLPTTPADKSVVGVLKLDTSANIVTIAAIGGAVLNKPSGPTSTTLVVQNQLVMLQYATSGNIWYETADTPVAALDTRYATKASPTFTGVVTLPSTAPTATTQAVNKNYVDTANNLKAPLAGPTFTGIVTLPSTAPTVSTQAVNKGYVDTADNLRAPLASPTFTGTVTVPTPVNSTDASTKAYVDSAVSGVTTGATPPATTSSQGTIQLAGDLAGTATAPTVPSLAAKAPLASPTFTGTVTVPAPVNSTDASTKAYVDTVVSSVTSTGAPAATTSSQGIIQLAGDLAGTATAPTVPSLAAKAPLASPTFTGTVTVPTPVNATDATTKTYVDSAIGTATADATATSKGKLQLAGDLAGTAAAPTVNAVKGVVVSGTPTTGQVLTATGTAAATWSTPASGGSGSSTNVVVYNTYAAAPALPANTVVISVTGS